MDKEMLFWTGYNLLALFGVVYYVKFDFTIVYGILYTIFFAIFIVEKNKRKSAHNISYTK